MLIDWFTVAAQMVNFLILLWLMKRFLYKPVLKALDEREKKIAAELNHASAVEEEASRQKSEWQGKNDDFEQQRTLMMHQVEEEVGKKRIELLESARKEYNDQHEKLLETLRREKEDQEEDALRRIRSEIFSVAGKLLRELADETLEERIVDCFCRKLRETGKEEIGEMKQAMEEKGLPILRSAFRLEAAQQDKISKTTKELLSLEDPLSFETSDELGCGIELCMNGRCISWNIDVALDSLRKASEQTVRTQTPSTRDEHGAGQ
jgi:F-type H+-transporting ATPase subunit b